VFLNIEKGTAGTPRVPAITTDSLIRSTPCAALAFSLLQTMFHQWKQCITNISFTSLKHQAMKKTGVNTTLPKTCSNISFLVQQWHA
jgi:hypothetical protein